MKKLWQWDDSYGYGMIEGLFLATEEEVKHLLGKTIYLGEVCGKHSEVTVEIEDWSFFTEIPATKEEMAFLSKKGLLYGYDLVESLKDQEEWEEEE